MKTITVILICIWCALGAASELYAGCDIAKQRYDIGLIAADILGYEGVFGQPDKQQADVQFLEARFIEQSTADDVMGMFKAAVAAGVVGVGVKEVKDAQYVVGQISNTCETTLVALNIVFVYGSSRRITSVYMYVSIGHAPPKNER
jgi:hypothetical protein